MTRRNETIWHIGSAELSLERPRVMGVVNVTPDSFSDGGEAFDQKAALSKAYELLDAGADIIDVGGESTRPGFVALTPEEESARIVGVVRELLAAGAIVSVDTRHAATAKLCCRLGAHIVNDVTGFIDPAMVAMAAETDCGLVVCRSVMAKNRSVPGARRRRAYLDTDPRAHAPEVEEPDQSLFPDLPEIEPEPKDGDPLVALMADDGARTSGILGVHRPLNRRFPMPESAPVMRQVMGFLGDQARILRREGVEAERIALDPGCGFGTTVDEDVIICRAVGQMVSMGYPLVCAVSRKRFVGAVSGVAAPADRDAASLGVALAAVEAGARIVRTHDVASLVQALDAWRAISTQSISRAFISLGSNVGDRVGYLARAVKLIDELPMTCVFAVSNAYESDPALGIATPVANAVCEIRTELEPRVLLGHLLEIERTLGRIRRPGASGPQPRTIDLDLVFYEDERSAGSRLMLPHPGLLERDFVLVPMEDLMPDPERYLAAFGLSVVPREERIGIVRADLGELEWLDS